MSHTSIDIGKGDHALFLSTLFLNIKDTIKYYSCQNSVPRILLCLNPFVFLKCRCHVSFFFFLEGVVTYALEYF